MAAKPRRINQLFQQQSALKSLYAEVQQQQQLLALVRQTLPPNLAEHCCEARLRGTVLTLFTDTPVWASKLRFITPRLLSELRSQFPGLASISVKTQVAQRRRPVRPRRKNAARHSDRAAATVDDGADSVTSPALRFALKRLARALRKD